MEFSSILVSLFLVLLGYLCGSIPTAYVVGKWLKGIDLREYGSGTVSSSMVWVHVAHWVGPLVGIFDILKAAFPAWLGMKLGSGPAVATIAGLAAVIGHNWPIFLHFTGGRGISPSWDYCCYFPMGFPLATGISIDWICSRRLSSLGLGKPGYDAGPGSLGRRFGDHSLGGRSDGFNHPGETAGGEWEAASEGSWRAAQNDLAQAVF